MTTPDHNELMSSRDKSINLGQIYRSVPDQKELIEDFINPVHDKVDNKAVCLL